MSKTSTLTTFNQATNAQFQAWVTEAHNLFANSGLTQTSDTGQINPATATIPAINTSAGYEIWSFNDTLQSTAPIFIKIEYGSAAATATPSTWITIGTGSNGTGTLTGILFARQVTEAFSLGVASTTTPFFSFANYNATYGFLGIVFKVFGMTSNGATNCSLFELFINRTLDASGLPTATGMVVWLGLSHNGAGNTGQNGSMTAHYNFSTGFTVSQGVSSNPAAIPGCYIPFSITNTLRSGQAQVFRFYQVMPETRSLIGILGVMDSEIAGGSLFTATPFATPLTYLSIKNQSRIWNRSGLAGVNLAMLWQ